MKLQEWLNSQGKTVADMARDFNVVHCIVRRWAAGEVIPNREYMQRIAAYTGNAVLPNDFYKPQPPRQFTVFDYEERENRRHRRRAKIFCIIGFAAVLFTAYNIYAYNRSFDNCERLLAEIKANTAVLDAEIQSLNATINGLEIDYE